MSVDVEPQDILETSRLIWGALDRVAREQGDDVAIAAAIKNLHGNVAYLRNAVGDHEVANLLGDLHENVLAHAFRRVRRA